MKNDDSFWSWKHLLPDNWLMLVFGVVLMGAMLMILLIVIDVFIEHRLSGI